MARFERNVALLAKTETVYGTDAAPTGVANAILAVNPKIEPLLGEDVGRELSRPYMGNQGILLVGNHVKMTFEVEVAGAGAAGTAPKVGPILRACAMAEIITAATEVKYNPISKLQESASLYFFMDGVKHVLLGARGTWTLALQPNTIPRFVFTMTGLLSPIADAAMPVADISGFIDPFPVNAANTTVALHGYSGPCEGLTLDIGNQIEPRMLIGSESIQHVDRNVTGNVVLEATALATKNWFAIAQAHTKGTLAATHGLTAGNIFTVAGPAIQIGRPTYGASQKIINNSLPIMALPSAGNDELVLTFK